MEHSKEQDKNNNSDNSLTWVKHSINPIVMLRYFESVSKDIIKKQNSESLQKNSYDSLQSNTDENKNRLDNSNYESYLHTYWTKNHTIILRNLLERFGHTHFML